MKSFFIAFLISSLSLTFAKVDQNTGPHIIDSVFDVYNHRGSNEGLDLAEIKENLENTFGMLQEHIEKDFETIDKNGDGLVSKEEGVNAFTYLDRSIFLDIVNGIFSDKKTVDTNFSDLKLLLYTDCGNNPEKINFGKDKWTNRKFLSQKFMNHYFNASRPTKIIAHGFLNDADDFYKHFIEAYKKAGCGVNLICINWEEYSDADKEVYTRAAENAIVIGKMIGRSIVSNILIKELKQDPKLIHAIGYSLGAHLVGNIGKNSERSIGRITGLDPANKFFEDHDKRLKKEDADFVDVIHTHSGDEDDGYFSSPSRIGHADFYPNGGSHQPGCEVSNDIVWPEFYYEIESDFCNHDRAQRFYTDSIIHKSENNYFLSKRCKHYYGFKHNYCKAEHFEVLPMGEALDPSDFKTEGNYFLDTRSDAPYNKP